jgi:serine phosphatase RsbU (regulator of sigma subunit)
MGHGAPTAPIVGMIRSQLRESATVESRPHKLLAGLHQHMLQHGHPDMFMTLTLLVLDLDSLTAEFSVAGLPCPLLYRGGQCRPVTPQFGWTLGYPFDDIQFSSETVQVTHGDAFLFYTDGLSDAERGPGPQQDVLGAERSAEMFSDLCVRGAPGIADGLFTRVNQYRPRSPCEDDATALVVRVR